MMQERIEQALNHCTNIIYKYPELFSISKILRGYAVNTLHLTGMDAEFYCKHSIETKFELSGRIDRYLRGTKHLNYVIPSNQLHLLDEIYKWNVITVLMTYTALECPEDKTLFNQMLKQEGLIKC